MSLIINNILDPNDVGTVLSGSLGLFAGPGDVFYAKKSDCSYYPITSTTSGFNSSLIFNTFSYVLSITDGNSTQTASLIDLASGYYNAYLDVSTSSNVLTLIDGYSTLTASLAYYTKGFNTGMSYNTASNVLSITDGNRTISATLSLTGANTSLTFNPFNNVLSVVDGFGTKTASIPYYTKVDTNDTLPNHLFSKFIDGSVVPVKVTSGSYSVTNPKVKFVTKSITFTSRYTGPAGTPDIIPIIDTGPVSLNRGFPILGESYTPGYYGGWTVVVDNFNGSSDTPYLEDRYFGSPYPINGEGIVGTGSNSIFVLQDGTYNVAISGSLNLGPGFTASGVVAYRLQYLTDDQTQLAACTVPLTRHFVSISSNTLESTLYFSGEKKGLLVDKTLTGCGGPGIGVGGRFLLRVLNMTDGIFEPSQYDCVEITFEKVA